MTAYYNEFDKNAAAWLRELIKRGLIAPGDVDERSIEDVCPGDLAGYAQCHFFAGIGGWSYALRLAGWPDDRPVWTGSCPCQPFSAAGKGAGFDDERHLWPAFQHLIAQRRPPVVFGEQVASNGADAWIDLVHADLENLGYAFGCVPFPSAGVGAPHIRDRNYWLADSELERVRGERPWAAGGPACGVQGAHGERQRVRSNFGAGGSAMADGLANAERAFFGSQASAADHQGSQKDRPADWLGGCRSSHGYEVGPTNGLWGAADWLGCTDGKWRPVEPGTFPLADGIPARVVRLRGYGNAINAEAAAHFVRAFTQAESVMEAAA